MRLQAGVALMATGFSRLAFVSSSLSYCAHMVQEDVFRVEVVRLCATLSNVEVHGVA